MFYYYGRKASLVKDYPAPLYSTIVEPFAGSAAYSVHHLVRGSAARAVLIEKDERVVELWTRLLAMSPRDILALPIPEAGTRTSDWLYMTSATSNAVARCRQMTVTQRMPAIIKTMLGQIADTLPWVADRIEVILGDYSQAPDLEASWFIDPPYQPHVSKLTSSGTALPQGMGYARHCSSDSINYPQLADWVHGLKGQVVVVEQQGADWLPFVPLCSTHDSLGNSKVEMVWEGGRSPINRLFPLDVL